MCDGGDSTSKYLGVAKSLPSHVISSPPKLVSRLELLFARHVVPMGGRLTISFQHYFAG